MSLHLLPRAPDGVRAAPILPLSKDQLEPWLATQPARVVAWVHATGFRAEAGTTCLIADETGALERVLVGVDASESLWSYAALPASLPAGEGAQSIYALEGNPERLDADRAALGWALGAYAFTAYREPKRPMADLVWPKFADQSAVTRAAEATTLVRDLINTPAEDMGPEHLAGAARDLAKAHKARCTVTVGETLLKKNYPAIHAVGRASARPPRLIDLRWGHAGPRVTLIGKGVCFDTGGLDLKPSSGMRLMKKDMGGAAHVLGLASMIMAADLPLRLRVLIPAVENAVSGNALRPNDVIRTRKGTTVEIGNTDAEGRLVLADALVEADRENPDLIVDFATLTGAARVALGPSLPALFCNHDGVADALLAHGLDQADPVWRLPIHRPYRKRLDSKVADINNIANDSFAGAIVAALFLAEFVRESTPWVHYDIMAWNPRSEPGRPEGGEAMGLRATYALIEKLARDRGLSDRA